MITMTPQYIDQAGGLLQAISLKSAEVVRNLLQGTTIKQPPSNVVAKLDRLLVHTNPHLDEYMAVLLFRACLPPNKLHDLPLDEFTLTSSYNDQLAKVTWPSAAVFGIGGNQTGGAEPLLLFDEHVPEGKKKRDSSCTKMTKNKHLSGSLSVPLLKVIGEADHIDANANAHPKHLGNYIKWIHETEYVFSLGASVGDNIKDTISPMWKQALVEACLAAFMMGINDKKSFSKPEYWKQPAQDSLNYYAKYSLLQGEPKFTSVFNRLKSTILDYKTSYLVTTQADGSKTERLDSHGNPIPQLLVMPYLAALCQDYWGPYIGHIIMAHFWESRLQSQLAYQKMAEILKQTLGDGTKEIPYVRTPLGAVSLRHVTGAACQQDFNGKKYTPWVIEFVTNGVILNARAPLGTYLNSANNGIGYVLLRNTSSNNVVLSQGKNGNYKTWEAIFQKLIELEGNADVRGRASGCWHKTENSQGKLADFLLNGNPAHQYVPRTSLDADSLVEMISNLNG